jgi:hypothetical protein
MEKLALIGSLVFRLGSAGTTAYFWGALLVQGEHLITGGLLLWGTDALINVGVSVIPTLLLVLRLILSPLG